MADLDEIGYVVCFLILIKTHKLEIIYKQIEELTQQPSQSYPIHRDIFVIQLDRTIVRQQNNMNTADEIHRRRTRDTSTPEKIRNSTELSSSRSSKARIKIISTKFPEDFFQKIKLKLEVQEHHKPPTQAQQVTPKFSNKRSLRQLKVPQYMAQSRQFANWNKMSVHQSNHKRNSDIVTRAPKILRQPIKRGSNTQEKICSYLHDVIQLTSSLKKITKKNVYDQKKYSLQVKGTIFNRENIELPPLVERINPEVHL